jgi:hypothetical protein
MLLRFYWILIVTLCLASMGAPAEVYQCTDSQGQVTFSDQPCGGKQKIISAKDARGQESLALDGLPPEQIQVTDARGQITVIKTLGGYRSPFTLDELLRFIEGYPWPILGYFATPPLLALLLWLAAPRERRDQPPLTYLYSLLVYLVCIPGVFSALLLGYAVFFLQQNVLELSALIYFLPPAAMLLTLAVIGNSLPFNEIPGVNGILGLITLLAISFGGVLFIYKTHLFIGFFGSIETLMALALGLFVLFKWGLKKMRE